MIYKKEEINQKIIYEKDLVAFQEDGKIHVIKNRVNGVLGIITNPEWSNILYIQAKEKLFNEESEDISLSGIFGNLKDKTNYALDEIKKIDLDEGKILFNEFLDEVEAGITDISSNIKMTFSDIELEALNAKEDFMNRQKLFKLYTLKEVAEEMDVGTKGFYKKVNQKIEDLENIISKY